MWRSPAIASGNFRIALRQARFLVTLGHLSRFRRLPPADKLPRQNPTSALIRRTVGAGLDRREDLKLFPRSELAFSRRAHLVRLRFLVPLRQFLAQETIALFRKRRRHFRPQPLHNEPSVSTGLRERAMLSFPSEPAHPIEISSQDAAIGHSPSLLSCMQRRPSEGLLPGIDFPKCN